MEVDTIDSSVCASCQEKFLQKKAGYKRYSLRTKLAQTGLTIGDGLWRYLPRDVSAKLDNDTTTRGARFLCHECYNLLAKATVGKESESKFLERMEWKTLQYTPECVCKRRKVDVATSPIMFHSPEEDVPVRRRVGKTKDLIMKHFIGSKYKSAVKEMWKIKGFAKAFQDLFLRSMRKEINVYAKWRHNIFQKPMTVKMMKNFTWTKCLQEVNDKAPKLISFLLALISRTKVQFSSDNIREFEPILGFLVALITHTREPNRCTLVQKFLSVEMYRCGSSQKLFKLFQKLNVSLHITAARNMVKKFLKDLNKAVIEESEVPLATRDTNSSLPRPSTKLPVPDSKSKGTTLKRCRSPDDRAVAGSNVSVKRSRVENTVSVGKPLGSSTPRNQANFKVPNGAAKNAAKARRAQTRPGLSRSSSTSSLNQTKPATRTTRVTSSSAFNNTITGRPASTNTNDTVPKPAPKSKRPAWDLKGRLQDMEQKLALRDQQSTNMRGQLDNNDERIRLLESQNSLLSGTVAQKEELTSAISQEASELKRKIRDTEDELDSARRKYQRELDEITRESRETQDSIRRKCDREIEDLNFKISSLERQKETLEAELKACREEISGLKSAVSQYTSAQAGLKSELEATQVSLDSSVKSGRLKDEEIRQLKETVAKQVEKLEEASQKMREHETMRRKLHNSIQELKGNIRVFCRVRPLLNEERLANDGVIQHMAFPDPDNRVLELDKLADVNPNESVATSLRRGTNKYEFTFDRVFQPDSSQAAVFEEISQLVQSALDGYNVCIFAYGQTGSGKTYTMEGPNDVTEESMGMIPRAVEQVFETAHLLEEKGWQYGFTASFLEIYNETIRDLLGNEKSDLKHEIKMLASGTNDVMVSDLTLVPVKSEKQVDSLLKKASENRAVAETKCNERSSRSHSVFQLKITGSNGITGESSQGVLSLVDLAGSERLKESGSEGQRLKEAKCINKSLSNLGNVIMALGNKENFVPYRNSKLTYLLQNSLGGNSKTLMFVNVSPKEECFQETLCSLRFATKVNQCNIGTAQKKVK